MKKFLGIVLFCVLFTSCLFAETDSFGYMYGNEAFASVMDAINTNTSYEKLQKIFNEALNTVGNDIATRLRLKIAYYDYLNGLDAKKYKKETKSGLESCYEDYDKLEKSNTIQVIKDCLTFLLYGIDYRITGSVSKGTKSIGYIDDLIKTHGDDDTVVLLYAQRKAEAPKIGGGDTALALELLTKLAEKLDNKTDAFKFAVFSELGLVYKKTDPSKSTYYIEKAKSLY